jgi:hypothetical protein
VPKRELEDTPAPGAPKGRLPARNTAPPEDAFSAAISLLPGVTARALGDASREGGAREDQTADVAACWAIWREDKAAAQPGRPRSGHQCCHPVQTTLRCGGVGRRHRRECRQRYYSLLCGAIGIRVTKASELDAALNKALSHTGPALVEVMTDPELVLGHDCGRIRASSSIRTTLVFGYHLSCWSPDFPQWRRQPRSCPMP